MRASSLASMSEVTSDQNRAPATPSSSIARSCSSRVADFSGGRIGALDITVKALVLAAPAMAARWAARISGYCAFRASSSPSSNGRFVVGKV